MSQKHGISKQTTSGWIKDKSKIFAEVESNKFSEKRQRMKISAYEDLDKACYKWLVNTRHQNVPMTGNTESGEIDIMTMKASNLVEKELATSMKQMTVNDFLNKLKTFYHIYIYIRIL